MIYGYFLFALILTQAIEGTIMFLIFKSKKFVYYIFLCNLLTNPALNLISLQVGHTLGLFWYKLVLAILEVIVVLVEGYIIYRLCGVGVEKSLLVALLINAASFGLGYFIIKFLILTSYFSL